MATSGQKGVEVETAVIMPGNGSVVYSLSRFVAARFQLADSMASWKLAATGGGTFSTCRFDGKLETCRHGRRHVFNLPIRWQVGNLPPRAAARFQLADSMASWKLAATGGRMALSLEVTHR
jgi:hypothetical protein